MFNIGAGEMILIALVLLIAVGPEQLPGLIRRAGRTMGQMRSMSDGLRRDFMSSMDELERASDPRKWAEGGLDDEPTSKRTTTGSSNTKGRSEKDSAGNADPDNVQSEPFSFSAPITVPPPFSSSADLEAMKNPPATDDEEPSDNKSPLTTDSAYEGLVDESDEPDESHEPDGPDETVGPDESHEPDGTEPASELADGSDAQHQGDDDDDEELAS